MRRLLTVLLLLGALAGCAEEQPEPPEAHTAPNGDRYTDGDVAYAARMIEEYAESLALADLAIADPGVDPAVTNLAVGIRERQALVVEELVTLLHDWGLPVPETVRDHAGAHEHEDEQAPTRKAWLNGMVDRHEEVAGLAKDHADRGENERLAQVARQVLEDTEHELGVLERVR